MVAQSTALKLANEYVQAVSDAGIVVKKAYLFGSFAQNRQHKWSDIDIALVSDEFIGVAAFDKDRFRHLHLMPQFLAIETHTFSLNRWLEGDPFIVEILKNAIPLHVHEVAVAVA